MTQLKVQDGQFKFRVRVQGKVVEKEIRVIVRGEFRYCSFREVDQVGRGALRRRGQVHAAFWGPDVFLDEKAVRACHLGLFSGWVASARGSLLRPDGNVYPWCCVRLCGVGWSLVCRQGAGWEGGQSSSSGGGTN